MTGHDAGIAGHVRPEYPDFDGYNGIATLYSGTKWSDLNSLVDPAALGAGYTLQAASSINNLGQILATSCDNTGFDCKSVLLTPFDLPTPSPVPEPATTTMLIAGATVVGLVQRRKARRARSQ